MKKSVMLLLAAALCAGPLFAQPGKGDWIASLNGSFSAAGVKSDSYKYHNLQLKPELLKMLKHNVTLGMVLGIDHTMIWRKDFQPEVDLRTHDLHLQFGPVVRKYFGKGRLVPYAELSAGVDYSMNFSKFSGESGSTYSSADAFIRPALGLSYWINDKVSFNISAGTDLLKPRYRELHINLGISVKLGK